MKKIISCAVSLIMCLAVLLSLCACDLGAQIDESEEKGIKQLEDELELQDEGDEISDFANKYNK